ncbi:MAG: PEP-CTERM sorting domain-containing protein [Gammaproteobacteria bacterium]|nr:MAG: PEP-CTERM sorting domain-containing protein [Gammaproteobacteria bacterium]
MQIIKLFRMLALGVAVAMTARAWGTTVTVNVPSLGGTEIFDLEVGGVFYDVAFEARNAAVFYRGPNSPAGTFDFTSGALASAARDAVNMALNDAGIMNIVRRNSSALDNTFIVPYSDAGGGVFFNAAQGRYLSGSWQAYFANGMDDTISIFQPYTTALFTPGQQVPEPGSYLLILAGLALLRARHRGTEG